MPWPPGQVIPHAPTPRTHQQNTLPPQDKKVPAAHPPPEDNFWNSPKVVCNISVWESVASETVDSVRDACLPTQVVQDLVMQEACFVDVMYSILQVSV